jgi:hypothetical protein
MGLDQRSDRRLGSCTARVPTKDSPVHSISQYGHRRTACPRKKVCRQ